MTSPTPPPPPSGAQWIRELLDAIEAELVGPITRAVLGFIRGVKRALLGTDGAPDMNAFPNGNEYDRAIEQAVMPRISKVFTQHFADYTRANPDNNALLADVKRQVATRLQAFPTQVQQVITKVIDDGLAEGASTAQLREQVADVIGDDSVWKWRAERIARTEATTAANAAIVATRTEREREADGPRMLKRWLAADDERTRPTHRIADGQTVALGEPFTVGRASMQFPGDPTAPPGEVINCRCVTIFVESDDNEDITAGGGPMPSTTTSPDSIHHPDNHVMPDDVATFVASIDDEQQCCGGHACGKDGDGNGDEEEIVENAITAALPAAPEDHPWDSGAAEKRITQWADGDPDKLAQAYLYRDPDADPATRSAYKFPIADVIDGTLTLIPRAVFAAAGRLDQADLSESASAQIRSKINALYEQLDKPSPLTAAGEEAPIGEGVPVDLADSHYSGVVSNVNDDGTVTVEVVVSADQLTVTQADDTALDADEDMVDLDEVVLAAGLKLRTALSEAITHERRLAELDARFAQRKGVS